MNRRLYRLWDYTPSHGQLLIRSLADGFHPRNDDYLFAGVAWLNLPESITELVVEPMGPVEMRGAEQLQRYALLSRGEGEALVEVGQIIAETYQHDVNDRDFGDSSLRVSPPSSGRDFERQVLGALSRVPWADMTVPPADMGIDALLTTPHGERVLVEAKYVAGRSVPKGIRATVMSLIRTLDRQSNIAGVLVILGGADEAYEDELRRHLSAALSGRPQARLVRWDPLAGWEALVEAVGAARPTAD